MSRANKVNPGRYTTAGRLTPDDLGRERQRQAAPAPEPEPAPRPRRGAAGRAGRVGAETAAKPPAPRRR